jgi:glucose-6-phosphate dehydrogenase assembly protein OpcA
VAAPAVLDRWSGEGMRLSEVVSAVASLHDPSRRGHARTTTAVMTLVAVAAAEDHARLAVDAMRAIAGHHPARILLVRPYPDEAAYLSAEATLYGSGEDEFVEVSFDVRGQAARHLDSLVEAFVLPDLPVAVWYVSSVPDPADPLLGLATVVVLDSRDAPDVSQLRGVLALARSSPVVDLCWKRLGPCRELLAGLFDPPQCRVWLPRVGRAEVAGKSGPRRLLAGWLVAQTSLSPKNVTTRDARHVSLRLWAGQPGDEASFSVERPEGQRLFAAEALVPGGAPLRATAELPDDPLATSLAAALTQMSPDPVWERALSVAAAVADSASTPGR